MAKHVWVDNTLHPGETPHNEVVLCVLVMKNKAYMAEIFGPYIVRVGRAWDEELHKKYEAICSIKLWERLMEIEQIVSVSHFLGEGNDRAIALEEV